MAEVLVVDDDPDTTELISDVLLGEGYAVRCASGREAIAAVDGDGAQPDVILLDLHMADIDGLAVGRLLRDDPRTRSIPIVIMSGDVDAVRRGAPDVDADGLLIKPFDLYDLLSQVNRLAN